MKNYMVAGSLFLFLTLGTKLAFSGAQVEWGGELRFRPEMRNNKDFDSDKYDNEAFIGQRVRLGASIKRDEKISAFVQIQDSRQWGSVSNVGTAVNENVPATNNENLDIYQAFVNVKEIGVPQVSAKIGRQTLVYGDQRLLGHLGWTDGARSFDAIKGRFSSKIVDLDLFFSKLKEGAGKPSTSGDDQDLWGLYGTLKAVPGHELDAYYFYWKNDTSRKLSTYGLRLKGKAAGKIDYTGELVFQSGDWAKGVTQDAVAWAVKAGYSFDFFISRVGIELAHGSGDDGSDATKHEDFVFPFHTNHAHYGFMDYFSWGNMNDLRLKINGKAAQVKWQLDYHYLTLAEGKGEWLNVVGTKPFKGAVSGKESTEAGQEVDITVKYIHSASFKVIAGYSLFVPGDAAKERSLDKDDNSTWGYVQTVFNF